MKRWCSLLIAVSLIASFVHASSEPVRGRNGMVTSQKMLASEAGLDVLRDGGSDGDDVHPRRRLQVTYTIERPLTLVIGAVFFAQHRAPRLQRGSGTHEHRSPHRHRPQPRRSGDRALSSMSPTIVARDGELFMITRTPGGRTVINTVLQTIVHAIDFGMNARETIDAGRFHHQWLPDKIRFEAHAFSPDTLALLKAKGHACELTAALGCAQLIMFNRSESVFEGGSDLRRRDGGIAAY